MMRYPQMNAPKPRQPTQPNRPRRPQPGGPRRKIPGDPRQRPIRPGKPRTPIQPGQGSSPWIGPKLPLRFNFPRPGKILPWLGVLDLLDSYGWQGGTRLDGGLDYAGWDVVVQCPFAGDSTQPANQHIEATSVSAYFNCGIFAFGPDISPYAQQAGANGGKTMETWHNCTSESPFPYYFFPGEWASIDGYAREDEIPAPLPYTISSPVAKPWPSPKPTPDDGPWYDPLDRPFPRVRPTPRKPPFEETPYRPKPESPEGTHFGPSRYERPKEEPKPRPNPKRAPRDKKERKYLGPVAQAIFAVWEASGEAKDFVESLADAVRDDKCKNGSFSQKSYCVYKHIDDIDWWKALENLLYNAVEDGVIGRISAKLETVGIGVGFDGKPYVMENFVR